MKPVDFPGANRRLVGPPDSGIADLPAWTNGQQCISCWGMTWRERIIAVLTGKVWLMVRSGRTQPPVKLTVEDPQIPMDQEDVDSIVKAALKRLRKSAAVLALLLLAGCATGPATAPSASGAYSSSEWYQIKGGVLYAWDGIDWYSLRTPQFEAGSIGGVPVSQVECWIKTAGDRNQCYMRTLATFQDKHLRPVFMPY